VNPEDNLSISEIIAQKYHPTIVLIRTPEEASEKLIKDAKKFNVNNQDYTEGS